MGCWAVWQTIQASWGSGLVSRAVPGTFSVLQPHAARQVPGYSRVTPDEFRALCCTTPEILGARLHGARESYISGRHVQWHYQALPPGILSARPHGARDSFPGSTSACHIRAAPDARHCRGAPDARHFRVAPGDARNFRAAPSAWLSRQPPILGQGLPGMYGAMGHVQDAWCGPVTAITRRTWPATGFTLRRFERIWLTLSLSLRFGVYAPAVMWV